MNNVSAKPTPDLSDVEMDAIMEKIQKMMRLRDNPGATVGEVANAGAMIQDLLIKYNLAMEDIESHEPARKEANDYQKTDPFEIGASSNYRAEWRGNLLNSVARNNFCRLVMYSRQKKSIYGDQAKDARAVLIGKPYNVQVVKDLYEWLAEQVNRLCTKHWTEYHRYGGGVSKKIWKTSFFMGAVDEINVRLVRAKREAAASNANVNALMVVSDQGLQKAYEKYYPTSALATVQYEYHWFEKGTKRGEMRICQHKMKSGQPCGQEKGGWLHYRQGRTHSRMVSTSAYEKGVQAGRQVDLTPRRKVEGRGSSEQRRMS